MYFTRGTEGYTTIGDTRNDITVAYFTSNKSLTAAALQQKLETKQSRSSDKILQPERIIFNPDNTF
jgi:hypothetical protein